jgi:hypothetical protein
VVIGQAMMALADTVMVLAICEKLGRFATLATISLTTNFLRAAVRKRDRRRPRGEGWPLDGLRRGHDVHGGGGEPIAQSLLTFAVLPDGAGAFNRADGHAGEPGRLAAAARPPPRWLRRLLRLLAPGRPVALCARRVR